MAYRPMAQAGQLRQGLLESEAVRSAASAHGATLSQILLFFLLSRKGVLPIPRASRPEHTVENAAAQIHLSPEELSALDHTFPAQGGVSPSPSKRLRTMAGVRYIRSAISWREAPSRRS